MSEPIPNNSPALLGNDEFQIWKSPKRERWLELRKQFITSTEIAPVSGITKYGNTRFSIYHAKRGTLEDSFVPNVRSELGKHFEHGISKAAADELGARVVRLADFMGRGRLGASFDYEVSEEGHEFDQWLVECKNVDGLIFRDQWDKDEHGRIVPPEHIILQTQAQLEVSGRPGSFLAVAVGGSDFKLLKIARDHEMGAALRKIANDFWFEIAMGNEPEVIAEDAKNAIRLYKYADPDHVWDATEDAELSFKIATYQGLKLRAKEAEAEADALKAQVLVEIKEASKVFCMDGYTLDAGITKASLGKEITLDMVGDRIGARKEFRRFTVRKKKGGA